MDEVDDIFARDEQAMKDLIAQYIAKRKDAPKDLQDKPQFVFVGATIPVKAERSIFKFLAHRIPNLQTVKTST